MFAISTPRTTFDLPGTRFEYEVTLTSVRRWHQNWTQDRDPSTLGTGLWKAFAWIRFGVKKHQMNSSCPTNNVSPVVLIFLLYNRRDDAWKWVLRHCAMPSRKIMGNPSLKEWTGNITPATALILNELQLGVHYLAAGVNLGVSTNSG